MDGWMSVCFPVIKTHYKKSAFQTNFSFLTLMKRSAYTIEMHPKTASSQGSKNHVISFIQCSKINNPMKNLGTSWTKENHRITSLGKSKMHLFMSFYKSSTYIPLSSKTDWKNERKQKTKEKTVVFYRQMPRGRNIYINVERTHFLHVLIILTNKTQWSSTKENRSSLSSHAQAVNKDTAVLDLLVSMRISGRCCNSSCGLEV